MGSGIEEFALLIVLAFMRQDYHAEYMEKRHHSTEYDHTSNVG